MVLILVRKSQSARTVWIEIPFLKYIIALSMSQSARTVWIEIICLSAKIKG